jgi:hypothetical protein
MRASLKEVSRGGESAAREEDENVWPVRRSLLSWKLRALLELGCGFPNWGRAGCGRLGCPTRNRRYINVTFVSACVEPMDGKRASAWRVSALKNKGLVNKPKENRVTFASNSVMFNYANADTCFHNKIIKSAVIVRHSDGRT